MWRAKSINSAWVWLITSWFLCGIVATLAGFFGFFYPALSILLVLPAIFLSLIFLVSLKTARTFSGWEKAIIALISIWWLLHSIQVFVPETGFDAVWYHLPLAKQTVSQHRFVGDLNFYQSFNPQFSDSIFYLGYAIAEEFGAKVVAYMFGLTLVLTTYVLSRRILSRTHALLSVLLMSSFQVVSWQSSSFYIDIAKAVWELSAVTLIISSNKNTLKSGMFLGASFASKLFSVVLLPIMAVLVWLNSREKNKSIISFITISILVAAPFYLFAYHVSANPFYSAFHHTEKIQEIGNAASTTDYILKKTISLPLALFEMVVTREYTTPLIILFLPLIIISRKIIGKNKIVTTLALFALYQLVLWWYIPPTSVRYALSGFIVATLVVIYCLNLFCKSKQLKLTLLYVCILFGVLALPIRISVALRSWQYISGKQTTEQYLQQFYDGNIDHKLRQWHTIR